LKILSSIIALALLLSGMRASAQASSTEVLLFTYFRNNGVDGVHLATSTNGVDFVALNNDQAIFTPPQWANGQNLTRDASILYHDGKYRMVWTSGWTGRIFGYAESVDLVNWSTPQQVTPFPPSLPALDQPDNVWAPEIHWDPLKQDYFILFSSSTPRERNDGDNSNNDGVNGSQYDNRVYITRTTDFVTFSPAQLFFDRDFASIDAVMRRDEVNQRWVMFIKCSRNIDLAVMPGRNLWQTFTGLDMDQLNFSPLQGPIAGNYSPMFSNATPSKQMAEGPSLLWVNDRWILIWDEPAGNGLQLATSPDLSAWTHVKTATFPSPAQHGTLFLAPRENVGWLVPPVTVNIATPGAGGTTLGGTSAILRLNATVAGNTVPPVIEWSKISGPGTVSFGNAAAVDTMARFSTPGLYTLQCQATAGVKSGSAQVSVNVLAAGATGVAGPMALRQGVNGYQHLATFIRSDSTGWNAGARDQFLVGRLNSGTFRTLFSFDLSTLPANTLVTGATLNLWTHTAAGSGTLGALELHSLASTPVEGTGDSSSSATVGANTGATWLTRTGGSAAGDLWVNAGGDFSPVVLASAPGYAGTSASYPIAFTSSAEFASSVQTAASMGRPLAMALTSPASETSGAFSRICSDDFAALENRPLLTLSFDGNFAPTVSCGPAPSATKSVPASIRGTAGNASASLWTLVSGPGDAVFSDPAQLATTVTFSLPGTYVLRLTGTNEFAQVLDEMTVSVVSNFASWQFQHWPGSADPAVVGLMADPDSDGLANLLEFATGSPPGIPSRTITGTGVNGSVLEFTYPRSHAAVADGVIFTVEWSDTLGNEWTSEGVTQAAVPETDNGTTLLWKASIPASPRFCRFVRLKVTSP